MLIGPVAVPSPAVPLSLDQVCAEFPRFRIWREITPGRTRYVARSPGLRLNPYVVVTEDLAELRNVLLSASPGQPSPPG